MNVIRFLSIGCFMLATSAACSTVPSTQPSNSSSADTSSNTTTETIAVASPTSFKVRIENISLPDGQTATTGVKWSLGFSPGMWAVHTSDHPVFTPGELDRSKGLEAQSEDGKPDTLVQAIAAESGVASSGIFNTPVSATEPAAIRPGESYEFTVSAVPGDKLTLTTMFGQSNDWFYAPSNGIALFDASGQPNSGDVTSLISLWDVGTEVDQEPGIGSEQGPRQKADNTGEAEQNPVSMISEHPTFPATEDVMRVTITPAN